MKLYRCILTLAPLVLSSFAFAQQISATVNGETVHFTGVQPMMINGRVMVPLRGVFEHARRYFPLQRARPLHVAQAFRSSYEGSEGRCSIEDWPCCHKKRQQKYRPHYGKLSK